MKNLFAILLLLLLNIAVNAQNNEYYVVTSEGQNLRSSDGTEFNVLATLVENAVVKVIDKSEKNYWIVEHNGTKGFFPAKFLKKRSTAGWIPQQYETGDTPICEKVNPQHDYNIENHLKITVNSDTDIVLKLMRRQKEGDVCIRTVFIKSYDFMVIRHIPQGKYYLKIAYGNDWRQKKTGSNCQGMFLENAHYEIGKQQLNFNLIDLGNQVQTPSYALTLGTKVKDNASSTFVSNPISHKEFEK